MKTFNRGVRIKNGMAHFVLPVDCGGRTETLLKIYIEKKPLEPKLR